MQKFIIGEVRTVEGVRRDATHKVGSQKTPEGIDLLYTSIGGYFIPNITYTDDLFFAIISKGDHPSIFCIKCDELGFITSHMS